jgi:hypothetical protein
MPRSRIVGAMIAAAILIGAYATSQYATSQDGGSPTWAGTFDCYGTTGCSSLPTPPPCTQTISNGLQTALNNASGGEVICLNSGTYGDVTLSAFTYTSVVTVRPAKGATVTLGGFDLRSVTDLTITGNGGGGATASTEGVLVDASGGDCSHNLTFDHLTFNGGANVLPQYSCSHGLNILFDHDRFDNLGEATWQGRLNVQALGTGPTSQANGVTISNSHFGGAGPGGGSATDCSDGINTLGGAYGTQIGPGNEFTGIDQAFSDANCGGTHIDPIQGDGDDHDHIFGNYFHDNGSGSGGPQPNNPGDNNWTIENNVILLGVATTSVTCGSCQGMTFQHNVISDGTIIIETHSGSAITPSATLTNNVSVGSNSVSWDTTGALTHTYNLNTDKGGTHEISGTPVFVSSPASGYYHYELDSSSPGYHAGSDGKSMGICSTCSS